MRNKSLAIFTAIFMIAAVGAFAAGTKESATPAPSGPITLEFWHAMTGKNAENVENLAKQYNASQTQYIVQPVYKGSYSDTMNAGIAAFRAGQAPHIIQVYEVGTATMMAAKGAVKPVYQLMKEFGKQFDPKIYIPTITSYYSTAKGEMLSLPFNSSTAVMY